MPIHSQKSADGRELIITVEGRFDFSAHQSFRAAYERADASVERYVIDMAGASYIDSSALGMLLLLRDFAGGDAASISIRHCSDDVATILAIANFDQLFSIE